MEQGSIFQSNRSQAIRLPKAVALPEEVKRVDSEPVGASLLAKDFADRLRAKRFASKLAPTRRPV
ncbi:hypothetical protein ACNFH5_17575 [Pseudomonas sp. NY15435]|uniref:hypothetical protein n=1 Tax=Pseudomonas sp. NY15435 TaxID=3400358 RepID=UPI003A8C3297